MKRLISALFFLALMPLMPSSATAKSSSGTIAVGATLVNGSNVVLTYIVGNTGITRVRSANEMRVASPPVYGQPRVIRIGFDLKTPFFVKRVTWDKLHRQLTIDF